MSKSCQSAVSMVKSIRAMGQQNKESLRGVHTGPTKGSPKVPSNTSTWNVLSARRIYLTLFILGVFVFQSGQAAHLPWECPDCGKQMPIAHKALHKPEASGANHCPGKPSAADAYEENVNPLYMEGFQNRDMGHFLNTYVSPDPEQEPSNPEQESDPVSEGGVPSESPVQSEPQNNGPPEQKPTVQENELGLKPGDTVEGYWKGTRKWYPAEFLGMDDGLYKIRFREDDVEKSYGSYDIRRPKSKAAAVHWDGPHEDGGHNYYYLDGDENKLHRECDVCKRKIPWNIWRWHNTRGVNPTCRGPPAKKVVKKAAPKPVPAVASQGFRCTYGNCAFTYATKQQRYWCSCYWAGRARRGSGPGYFEKPQERAQYGIFGDGGETEGEIYYT